MKNALFITFEGIDGCGKTTQSILLYEYLKNKKLKVIRTREPGGTTISESIRKMLLLPEIKMDKYTELLLYEAARNQHVKEIIIPALKKNDVVISERYTDATISYQGYGRGIDLKIINLLNDIVTNGKKPDLTFLLDISPRLALKRLKSKDRFESEPIRFYERVRQGYLELASSEPERIKIINANREIDIINKEIITIFEEHIKCYQKM